MSAAIRRARVRTDAGVEGVLLSADRARGRAKVLLGNRHVWIPLAELRVIDERSDRGRQQ